jgi:dTDP-4-dehydrorhamnose reductase
MRILVFGRDGQLGKAFAKQFNKYPEVFFITASIQYQQSKTT